MMEGSIIFLPKHDKPAPQGDFPIPKANQNALFLHHKKAHEIWTIKKPDADIVQYGATPTSVSESQVLEGLGFSVFWVQKRRLKTCVFRW